MKTDLLPRPWSPDRPKVEGYEPIIRGKVLRVGRRKRNSWRADVMVDGCPMGHSHHDTKAAAESKLAGMIRACAAVHYTEA